MLRDALNKRELVVCSSALNAEPEKMMGVRCAETEAVVLRRSAEERRKDVLQPSQQWSEDRQD